MSEQSPGTVAVLSHISEHYKVLNGNIVRRYRDTFGKDEDTQWVLRDLLNMLMYADTDISSGEEGLVHSLAILLKAKCGMHAPQHVDRGYELEALWKMPPLAGDEDIDEEKKIGRR